MKKYKVTLTTETTTMSNLEFNYTVVYEKKEDRQDCYYSESKTTTEVTTLNFPVSYMSELDYEVAGDCNGFGHTFKAIKILDVEIVGMNDYLDDLND